MSASGYAKNTGQFVFCRVFVQTRGGSMPISKHQLPRKLLIACGLSVATGTAFSAAPTVSLVAEPASIPVGSSTTLTWSSTDATSCVASGSWSGTVATSGRRVSTPPSGGTKVYTLTCSGPEGSASASASVSVSQPPPTVTMTVDKPIIALGESVTVTWDSTWSHRCEGQGDWSGDKAADGSEVLTPKTAKIVVYRMKCYGSERRTTLRDVSVQVEAAPRGLSSRPVLSPLGFPTRSAQQGDVGVVNAFPNLTFLLPLVVTARPNDNSRLFVATQEGLVHSFENNPATTSTQVFMDLRNKVNRNGGEVGLLGLVFDPEHATNGWLYVHYNPAGVSYRARISRFKVMDSDPLRVDMSSERVFLEFDSVNDNHKGGWIGIGPDGKLYTSSGEGGVRPNGQKLSTLLGKLIRLNRDGSIPDDNPFVGIADARGEIWAYGFRNPFRMSFDRDNGNLWAGDVGANSYEEVNLVTRGGNYGWADREGRHGFPDPNAPKPAGSNFIDPIVEYDHGVGCSVIGGYVYRGRRIPSLYGQYVFSDYCSSELLAFPATGEVSTAGRLASIPTNPSSFGEDASGELYITGFDGNIYTLVRGSGATGDRPFPQKLSETGLFSNLSSLTPNPGLIEYSVRAPLWSDGATKRRWFGVPNSGVIKFSAGGAWQFPHDSVTVKHFDIKLANGKTRRLETRVFVRFADGWQGYTYKWNSAKTEAFLVGPAGDSELINTINGPQLYEWPSRTACLTCHNTAAGHTLGLRTNQINTDRTFPNGVKDNQLLAYKNVGLFDSNIGDISQYAKLGSPSDTKTTLSRRARGYLEANCSICHQPGGPTPVSMDLRASTGRNEMRVFNVPPTSGDLGIPNAARIVPGSKERSLVWERMRRLDDNRMPNLSSHVVDPLGVGLIGEWIDAGAP